VSGPDREGKRETDEVLRTRIMRQDTTLTILGKYLSTHLPPFPRLYLWSKTDRLIPYEDVVAHGKQAEKDGVVVRMEEFVGIGRPSRRSGREVRA
jgi:hypothetical protein